MPECDFNKVAGNFIEIILRHKCSPVNLLRLLRTPLIAAFDLAIMFHSDKIQFARFNSISMSFKHSKFIVISTSTY